MASIRLDRILSCIPPIMLIGLCIWIGTQYAELPSQIPMHYGSDGNVDSLGDKSTLWLLAAIAWVLCIMSSIMPFLPQAWMIKHINGTEGCTAEGKEKIYHITMDMLPYLNIVTTALFCYIAIAITLSMPMLYLAPFVVIIGIILAMMLIKTHKVKKEHQENPK